MAHNTESHTQGHHIIIIRNRSLINSYYIFYCLDKCYDKTVFPPNRVSKIYAVQKYVSPDMCNEGIFCPQLFNW